MITAYYFLMRGTPFIYQGQALGRIVPFPQTMNIGISKAVTFTGMIMSIYSLFHTKGWGDVNCNL